MREITEDTNLVAYCGLYCGACRQYLREKCPGCMENIKATWCKLRTCCKDKNYRSCAECTGFKDVNECKKFNNILSKVFALLFRSNRKACIQQIQEKGISVHTEIMTRLNKPSLHL
jgi:hypothetical protein